MRLYLDDDTLDTLLIRLLQRAGHDVAVPTDFGLAGESDPRHLQEAIHERRVLPSQNHDDFEDLHWLLMEGQGHHPGILIIRRNNDPTKDMQAHHIGRAVGKLEAAGVPITDEFIILNQWR